jgi:hypothetical protein
MNAAKNPRGPGRAAEQQILSSTCVRIGSIESFLRPVMVKVQTLECVKNMHGEPLFRHWLFCNIVRCVELDVDEVVDCGAELTGLSQETVKRYLHKLTSRFGIYRYVESADTGKNLLRLKPKYQVFRRKIDQRARLDAQAKNWKNEMLADVPGIGQKRRQKDDMNRPREESHGVGQES